MIRAVSISRQKSAIAATLCVPPCVAMCPQAKEMSRESVRTAVPLVRIPRSRAPAGQPAPFVPEEGGAPCVKDLGYGNNTVPMEFAG